MDYAVVEASIFSVSPQSLDAFEVATRLRKAIEVGERMGVHRQLAVLRTNLINVLNDIGQYREAETVLMDDLLAAEKEDGSDPARGINQMLNLTIIRFCQKRYEEAASASIQLLQNPDLVRVLPRGIYIQLANYLAASQFKMGLLRASDASFSDALNVCEKVLGEKNPTCVAVLRNYAEALRCMKRKAEAKRMKERASQAERAANRRNGAGWTTSVKALRSEGK